MQAARDLSSSSEPDVPSSPAAPDHGLRMDEVLSGITDPFAVCAADWRVLLANEASAQMLGVSCAQMVGRQLWDVVPDVLGTRLRSELERAMADRQPVTVEEHHAELDRWYEMRAYPLPNGGLAVWSRDVSARKREQDLTSRMATYAALRADVGAVLANEREIAPLLQRCCEAIVKHLPLAFARVWLVDSTSEWLDLKASAGRYTHLDGDHRRVRIGEFKIGRIAAERKAHLTNAVLEDELVSNKSWAAREGMVSFAGYPLVVGDELIGVLAGFAAVTMPDDTMTALGAISDAVAHGTKRRRAEIELDERVRDLARSNAELEQFAYVASHDLQEPLRMVASYNQLLARRYKGKLDADADDFIGYAVEGVTRMQRLINDLLLYSRVGSRSREATMVSMNRVMTAVARDLEHAIADAQAVVTHDDLPDVLGDEGQFTQLLQNLVGNAIKFRATDPPRVHVSCVAHEDRWVFSVQDNGIGIEPQYFERIFVIFQRLHPREKYAGTGIGLAICKKIVERCGGRIWIESQPEQGSTIFFSIPAAPSRARSTS